MCIARKLVLLGALAIAAMAVAASPMHAATPPITDGSSNEPELHHQNPELDVRAEPVGGPCPTVTPAANTVPAPTVTTGGCRVHVSGTAITMSVHFSGGIEAYAAVCDVELDVRFDSAGEGWVIHQEFTDSVGFPGNCTRQACPQLPENPFVEAKAWALHLRETGPVAPFETGTLLFCLVSNDDPHGPAQTHCEIEGLFSETEGGVPTSHRYHAEAPGPGLTNGVPCHVPPGTPTLEFSGEVNVEMFAGTNGENESEQRIEINHT